MGEQLFELVEQEHRHQQVVVAAPQFQPVAVQVMPQVFVCVARRKVGAVGGQFFLQAAQHLVQRRQRSAGREVDAQIDGQVDGQVRARLAQFRHHAGLQQRAFAQTRVAVEHGQVVERDQPQHFGRLGLAALEEPGRSLVVLRQPRPGVGAAEHQAHRAPGMQQADQAGLGACYRSGRQHTGVGDSHGQPGIPRRASRSSLVSLLRRRPSATPRGAWPWSMSRQGRAASAP